MPQQPRTCLGSIRLTSRRVMRASCAPWQPPPFRQCLIYAATLDQEQSRYGELKSRLVAHLPANDEVRTSTCVAIDHGIAAFTTATHALTSARTQESLAKTSLDSAEEAWERQINKVYGLLLAELGRSAAESFFPKTRSSPSKNDNGNT